MPGAGRHLERNEDELQHIILTRWGTRESDRIRRGGLHRLLMALRSERVAGSPERERPAASDSASLSGHTSDFEAFFHAHEHDIFGYLWRMSGNEQTANDLTQEVFFRAWRQFEKLRGYERPEAWLFRVATNLALNERRHQRIAGSATSLQGHERFTGDHVGQLTERAALRAALESLPANQRAAFILRELYGYTSEEIGAIIGISRAAAKMTLSRARERLRALYLKESAE